MCFLYSILCQLILYPPSRPQERICSVLFCFKKENKVWLHIYSPKAIASQGWIQYIYFSTRMYIQRKTLWQRSTSFAPGLKHRLLLAGSLKMEPTFKFIKFCSLAVLPPISAWLNNVCFRKVEIIIRMRSWMQKNYRPHPQERWHCNIKGESEFISSPEA